MFETSPLTGVGNVDATILASETVAVVVVISVASETFEAMLLLAAFRSTVTRCL